MCTRAKIKRVLHRNRRKSRVINRGCQHKVQNCVRKDSCCVSAQRDGLHSTSIHSTTLLHSPPPFAVRRFDSGRSMSRTTKRESIRQIFIGYKRKAPEITAPIRLPCNWSRMLRFAPGVKVPPDHLVQVNRQQERPIHRKRGAFFLSLNAWLIHLRRALLTRAVGGRCTRVEDFMHRATTGFITRRARVIRWSEILYIVYEWKRAFGGGASRESGNHKELVIC